MVPRPPPPPMCSLGSTPAGKAGFLEGPVGPSQSGQDLCDRAQKRTQRPREGKGCPRLHGEMTARSFSGGEQTLREAVRGVSAGIYWSLAAFGCSSHGFPTWLPRTSLALTPCS